MGFAEDLTTVSGEMNAIVNFVDNMTAGQLAEVVRIQLKQKAFTWLYQKIQNVTSRHYNATMQEWLIRHGYEAGDEMEITDEMKVALYNERINARSNNLEANPGTTLDGAELEQAAQSAWVAEMNAIDAEINTALQAMPKATLSESVVYCNNAKAKVDGFSVKIDNMLKAAIVAAYKE